MTTEESLIAKKIAELEKNKKKAVKQEEPAAPAAVQPTAPAVQQYTPPENPFAMLAQLPAILQQFNKDIIEVKASLVELKAILKFVAPQR